MKGDAVQGINQYIYSKKVVVEYIRNEVIFKRSQN
jgi:hypothetical protein